MSQKTIKVLAISGSLRKSSLNTALIKHIRKISPGHISIEIFDLNPIPLFNEDVRLAKVPDAVVELKKKISEADALLFASPEYNFSISGVLKNAIDWASRPPKESPFNEKPMAIVSAAGGLGGARAQLHLRQIAVYLNIHALNKPEVLIPRAWEKFDENGNLIDQAIEKRILELLDSLHRLTIQLRKQ